MMLVTPIEPVVVITYPYMGDVNVVNWGVILRRLSKTYTKNEKEPVNPTQQPRTEGLGLGHPFDYSRHV